MGGFAPSGFWADPTRQGVRRSDAAIMRSVADLGYGPVDLGAASGDAGVGAGYGPSDYSPVDPPFIPYRASAPAPPSGTNRPAGIGYNPSRDARDVWANERQQAWAGGDVLDQDALDYYNYAQQNAGRYGLSADDFFAQLMEQAGYSPDEIQSIVREAETQGLAMTGDEYNNRFMTPEEEAAVRGNPYARLDAYRPEADRITDTFWDQTKQVNSGVDDATGRVDDAIGNFRGSVGRTADRYGAAIGSAQLTPADRAKLTLSQRYQDKRGWTDKDLEDVRGRAGRQVGAQYTSAIDELQRQAAASGNTNPLAVAVARQRLERGSAVDNADAMANADVASMATAKAAEQDIEDTRLGAEQGYEDRRFRGEATRLDAGMRAAEGTSAAEQAANAAMMAGGQYLGNLRTGVAERTRGAATDMQSRVGENVAGYTGEGEANQSNRSGILATNRQSTTVGGQGDRFQRGAYVGDRLSGRSTTVAEARRGDRNRAGDYYASQSDAWANRGQRGLDQRRGAYDSRTRATQGAATGYTDADNAARARPALWQRILGAATGALSMVPGGGIASTIARGVGAAAGGFSSGSRPRTREY